MEPNESERRYCVHVYIDSSVVDELWLVLIGEREEEEDKIYHHQNDEFMYSVLLRFRRLVRQGLPVF